MSIVLITGGAGFIGSHIVDRLVRDGFNVRILDDFSSGSWENIKHHKSPLQVKVLNGDLKNPQIAFEAVRNVNSVFHFAANPEVRVSTTNPEIHFNNNVVATFNLIEAMRRADVGELVFASSSSVYGEPESIPVNEDAPIRPVSVYGASKAACENLIYTYSHLYGIKAVILRYANVVGPRLRHGVVYDFIMKLLKHPEKLEILGDGTQTRSYIYISDAIEATITTWKNHTKTFNTYNVGSEDWININETAEIVIATMGLKNVKYTYNPILHGVGWLGDVKRIVLNISKLKSLGWMPKMKSREAISETVKNIIQELKQYYNPR